MITHQDHEYLQPITLFDEVFLGMTDTLKCVFCAFKHVIMVQCTTQFFYWSPQPRKYVCRHQCIYHTLTSTGDIVNLEIFGTGQAVSL